MHDGDLDGAKSLLRGLENQDLRLRLDWLFGGDGTDAWLDDGRFETFFVPEGQGGCLTEQENGEFWELVRGRPDGDTGTYPDPDLLTRIVERMEAVHAQEHTAPALRTEPEAPGPARVPGGARRSGQPEEAGNPTPDTTPAPDTDAAHRLRALHKDATLAALTEAKRHIGEHAGGQGLSRKEAGAELAAAAATVQQEFEDFLAQRGL
ncbi:hypothetical protein [Streptomyces sp. NPDC059918]|uniref:hypothetical protein n=1 Tax=unclassified Streptomyces TaxID=2593676 RepID=UPI0036569B6E